MRNGPTEQRERNNKKTNKNKHELCFVCLFYCCSFFLFVNIWNCRSICNFVWYYSCRMMSLFIWNTIYIISRFKIDAAISSTGWGVQQLARPVEESIATTVKVRILDSDWLTATAESSTNSSSTRPYCRHFKASAGGVDAERRSSSGGEALFMEKGLTWQIK